jgi:hypothetical protein
MQHAFTDNHAHVCQAAKSDCMGWLMYSCKSMNSATFIPAVKEILQIPDNVEIGWTRIWIKDVKGFL